MILIVFKGLALFSKEPKNINSCSGKELDLLELIQLKNWFYKPAYYRFLPYLNFPPLVQYYEFFESICLVLLRVLDSCAS